MNKIGSNSTLPSAENRNQKSIASAALAAEQPTRHKGRAVVNTDTVKLSPQATDLGKLEAKLGQLPEVDTTRVADLRNQLLAGTYQIDSEKVASKILDFESALEL